MPNFEWLIKKEDVSYWADNTQEVCGDIGAATAESCSRSMETVKNAADKSDLCHFRSKNVPVEGTDPENPEVLNSPESDQEKENNGSNCGGEPHFLQSLRTNPSLISSRTGSWFNQRSLAHLPAPEETTTKGDQGSVGERTLPNSDGGDNESQDNDADKEYRYSAGYIACVVFAVLLVFFSIGLGVTIMMRKRSQNQIGGTNITTAEDISNTTMEDLTMESDFSANSDTEQSEEVGANIDDASNNSTTQEQPSEEIVEFDYTANTNYLVGAYYYPWYSEDFHSNERYLRESLIPPQQPALGEYDDSNPLVIKQHMEWFRRANIGLLVTSWWGPGRVEDTTTKDVILKHEDVGNLKIALHYETIGRIKDKTNMSTPRSDIEYICENYFDHPNYYKIDGRPVLFVYVTRVLHEDGVLEEALLTMRSEASKCGHNLYLIGDQVFDSAPDPDQDFVPFWYFDAVTNYDVYGSSGRPDGYAGMEAVDKYYSDQQEWKNQALKANCRYIPPVSPGYNDRSVRFQNNNPPLSRRLSADAEEGSLFWYQLSQALELVDPQVDNMILVNSFNEWHEDTQIEPAVGVPGSPKGVTATLPNVYTQGLEYTAYGELYLDLLGAATSKNVEDHSSYDHLIQL